MLTEIVKEQYESLQEEFTCFIGYTRQLLELTNYVIMDKVNVDEKSFEEVKIINGKLQNIYDKLCAFKGYK